VRSWKGARVMAEGARLPVLVEERVVHSSTKSNFWSNCKMFTLSQTEVIRRHCCDIVPC